MDTVRMIDNLVHINDKLVQQIKYTNCILMGFLILFLIYVIFKIYNCSKKK